MRSQRTLIGQTNTVFAEPGVTYLKEVNTLCLVHKYRLIKNRSYLGTMFVKLNPCPLGYILLFVLNCIENYGDSALR